ncbi:hypothetical protein K9M48_04685 [Candidatus Gracilibacteria bacterium]|nr:hypothetical protein [Candidatus Gracilibacteria bacterium]
MKNSIKIGLLIFFVSGLSYLIPQQVSGQEIIIDPVTKTIYISGDNQSGANIDNFLDSYIESNNTGATNSGLNNTGNTQSNENANTTELIQNTTINNTGGNEFDLALAWMFGNGLTRYNNKTEYRPYDFITREEAAKMIGQAYIIFGYSQEAKNLACTFQDSNIMNPELIPYINNTCQRGILKGANGIFMPQDTMTKPQIMAVLLRMFEQKSSNESQIPRRNEYYVKGKAIGLTKESDINNFDKPVNRYEVALLIYRLQNIVSNDQLKAMTLNTLNGINANTNTNTSGQINQNQTEQIIDNLSSLFVGINVNEDPELIEAIHRMYDNGLTQYDSPSTYNPFGSLTREASAKILDIFSDLLGYSNISSGYSPSQCTFTDLEYTNDSLKTHIENACKKGLMQGGNGLFNPGAIVNKAQFVTSLIRMFEGKKLDENISPRWKNYFDKAQEIGIVSALDDITFENPISRYEVALFIYRFKVKFLILNNLNQSKIQDEIISTVPGSISSGTNGKLQANVYVDTNLLNNGNFNLGYVEILGNRYKIVKNTTSKYNIGENSFVRYGDIFDLESDNKIGTTSFIVGNGYIIEATVRINNNNYKIQASNETNAYYKINEI